jgi:hypothetical protein
MFLRSRARPVCKTDNLTAMRELPRQCGILNISQAYRPIIIIIYYYYYYYY